MYLFIGRVDRYREADAGDIGTDGSVDAYRLKGDARLE